MAFARASRELKSAANAETAAIVATIRVRAAFAVLTLLISAPFKPE